MKNYNLQDIVNQLNNTNNGEVYGNFLDDIRYKFKNNVLKENFFLEEPKFHHLQKRHISYFVATIHSLCNEFKMSIPKWVRDKKYILDEPYFAFDAKGNLKIVLLSESPYEFRSRNIYVTKDVLGRA